MTRDEREKRVRSALVVMFDIEDALERMRPGCPDHLRPALINAAAVIYAGELQKGSE